MRIFLLSQLKSKERLLGFFLIFTSFSIASYSYARTISLGGAPYQTGDWLINYSGGFVRRGLFGEIFLDIFGGLTWKIWILYSVQTLAYGVLYSFFAFELAVRQSNWFNTVLICSPAGILFYGWDPLAFGRKEIFVYLVLIIFSLSYRFANSMLQGLCWMMAGMSLFIIGILCWEPVILSLFAMLILIRLIFSRFSIRLTVQILVFLAFSIFSVFTFFLTTHFNGSISQSTTICQSLVTNGLNKGDLCTGAINALSWSTKHTLQMVSNSFPFYLIYIPLMLLAFLPLAMIRVDRFIRMIILCNSLCFIPLFLIVVDYGRWIAIIVIANLILYFSIVEPSSQSFTIDRKPMTIQFVSLLYLFAWGLPHYMNRAFGFPFVGALSTPAKIFYKYFVK